MKKQGVDFTSCCGSDSISIWRGCIIFTMNLGVSLSLVSGFSIWCILSWQWTLSDPHTKLHPKVTRNDVTKLQQADFDRCYRLHIQTGRDVKQKQPAYQAVHQLNTCHQIQWDQLPEQLLWICFTVPICLLTVASWFHHLNSLEIDLWIFQCVCQLVYAREVPCPYSI